MSDKMPRSTSGGQAKIAGSKANGGNASALNTPGSKMPRKGFSSTKQGENLELPGSKMPRNGFGRTSNEPK